MMYSMMEVQHFFIFLLTLHGLFYHPLFLAHCILSVQIYRWKDIALVVARKNSAWKLLPTGFFFFFPAIVHLQLRATCAWFCSFFWWMSRRMWKLQTLPQMGQEVADRAAGWVHCEKMCSFCQYLQGLAVFPVCDLYVFNATPNVPSPLWVVLGQMFQGVSGDVFMKSLSIFINIFSVCLVISSHIRAWKRVWLWDSVVRHANDMICLPRMI